MQATKFLELHQINRLRRKSRKSGIVLGLRASHNDVAVLILMLRNTRANLTSPRRHFRRLCCYLRLVITLVGSLVLVPPGLLTMTVVKLVTEFATILLS